MKMMMIVFLLLVSQHASGVEVYEGAESVLLHCQVPADVSRNFTSAVWDRVGLSNPTVHLRLQKSDNLRGQNDLYKDRTSMRVDALQTGDLSLTLKNPTVSDSGTYTCTAVSYGDRLSWSEVQLKVTEQPPPPLVWPKVLAAVLVTLIILAAAFGLFVYRAYKRMKDIEALQTEMVEVKQGKEFVQLPFKTTADLREDVTVEWTLTKPKRMVHVYESGHNQPDKQDLGYRGRTEMKEDPLRTKDFSLTLKYPRLTDSGVYTCTVNKDGHTQKIVILSVRVPPPEVVNVTDAEKSVLLPFITTADLPRNVTVEWTLSEPKHMKVHVYESGNNQPDKQDQDYRGRTEMDEDPLRTKDLSLTLKEPQTSHTGVYTCTVYNKDGHMLLQKSVTLSVRESVPDIVQVQKGQVSVQLPCKTTTVLPQDATVEWTLTKPKRMKVHMYESGKNQSHIQDQDNKDRTKMDEDPLRNKDLSLTLNKPHLTDSGVYTCTVCNKDGHMLLQKSVTLHVFDSVRRMGAACGDKSYLLKFEKPHKLHNITTVDWKLIYPKYKLIKEIKNHQGNEEDFSLNLEDIRLTDSGIYTCTAYDHNGDIQLQQSVILNVRDFQLEMVEVTEGQESVLLPFKTTADLHHVSRVDWTLTEDELKIVHVYQVPDGKKRAPSPHPPYRGRTEMNKDPLRTGDLSLTLKDLHPNDSRSYTCIVFNKDGRTLQQKVVILRVRATLKGTMADMLPCLRRRTAPKPEVKEELRNTNHEDVPLTAEETV